jgi:hypothetical protein
MNNDELQLGVTASGDVVTIPLEQSKRHSLILGPTGCGKTAWIHGYISQFVAKTDLAIIVIDSKGQLTDELQQVVFPHLERLGRFRKRRVGVVRPFQGDALPLDPLVPWVGVDSAAQAFNVARLLRGYMGIGDRAEGAVLELVKVALSLGLNLVDLLELLKRPELRPVLAARLTEPDQRHYLEEGIYAEPKATLASLTARLGRLLALPEMRGILAGRRAVSGADLLADDVTLVNLGNAPAGFSYASDLVGALTLAIITAAIFSRDDRGRDREVLIVLDEWQELAKHSHADLERVLAMGRSKGIRLCLANQDVAQIRGASNKLAASVLTNTGTHLLFRPTPSDITEIEPLLDATGTVPNPLAPDEFLGLDDERRQLARRLKRLRKREAVFVDRDAARAVALRTLTIPFDEMKPRRLQAPSTGRTRPLAELLSRSATRLAVEPAASAPPNSAQAPEEGIRAPSTSRRSRRPKKPKLEVPP